MSVFQDLYDSEINFQISTFWDGGFEVKLGDEMNGFKAEQTFQRFGSIEGWLLQMALVHFPESAFVRRYADELPQTVVTQSIDRSRDIRTQVLYMAKECAKSPAASDVIDAAETLADYIMNGKKPCNGEAA